MVQQTAVWWGQHLLSNGLQWIWTTNLGVKETLFPNSSLLLLRRIWLQALYNPEASLDQISFFFPRQALAILIIACSAILITGLILSAFCVLEKTGSDDSDVLGPEAWLGEEQNCTRKGKECQHHAQGHDPTLPGKGRSHVLSSTYLAHWCMHLSDKEMLEPYL